MGYLIKNKNTEVAWDVWDSCSGGKNSMYVMTFWSALKPRNQVCRQLSSAMKKMKRCQVVKEGAKKSDPLILWYCTV